MKKLYFLMLLLAWIVACKKNTAPSDNSKTYTITARAGANGSVDPTGTKTVDAGSSMFYVITPASNYGISSLAIDSKYVPVADSYTFTNVQGNHTINAEFAPLVKITVTTDGDGTASYSPAQVVPGQTVTFTFTPKPNHLTDSLYVDGKFLKLLAGETTFTLTNVVSEHKIAVTFLITSAVLDSLKKSLVGQWALASYQGKLGTVEETFFHWEKQDVPTCLANQYEEYHNNGDYEQNINGTPCSPSALPQFRIKSPNHWTLKTNGKVIYMTGAPKDSLTHVSITKDSLIAFFVGGFGGVGRISYWYHYARKH